MGKQKKKHRQGNRADTALDKPSYAADVILAPAKSVKVVRKETDVAVEEHLGKSTMDKLAALKSSMLAEQERVAGKDGKSQVGQRTKSATGARQQKSAAQRLEAEPDLSFAELFDPVDDDEGSFEELFGASKLDWEHFKQDSE